MAILPESFKAFQFQSGLEIVRDSFRASITTMIEASDRAHATHLEYVASGDDDREYDDDGILVRGTEHDLGYESMNAGLALSVIREAFITSAFHYWERSARAWTGLAHTRYRFQHLEAAVQEKYGVHPRLTHLNTLNNLLKHDNAELAEKLVIDWPSLFRPPLASLFPVDKPVRRRAISDDHVETAFVIVSASGPQYERQQ